MKPRIAILSVTIFAGTLAGAAVFAAVRPSDASPSEPAAEFSSQATVQAAAGVLNADEASFATTQQFGVEDEDAGHDEHDRDDDEHDRDHHDEHDDSHEDDD